MLMKDGLPKASYMLVQYCSTSLYPLILVSSSGVRREDSSYIGERDDVNDKLFDKRNLE